MIACTAWGYCCLFSLQQHSSVLSVTPDYFSPFPLKPFIPTHFFLDIVWKVVKWLFKNVFQAIDFSGRLRTARPLCSGSTREQMVTLMPGTERDEAPAKWWLWRGVILHTEKSPCAICYPSACSLHSIQYSTTFAVPSWVFFAIIKISFVSRACHSLLRWSGWWKGTSWRSSSSSFSSTDRKGAEVPGCCSGKDREVTSALSLPELLPWYKVLQKWSCAAPWADTNPLQSWSCRAKCAGVTHQLCHLLPGQPQQKVGKLRRGGKAAVRWQSWAVRA